MLVFVVVIIIKKSVRSQLLQENSTVFFIVQKISLDNIDRFPTCPLIRVHIAY